MAGFALAQDEALDVLARASGVELRVGSGHAFVVRFAPSQSQGITWPRLNFGVARGLWVAKDR